MCLACSAGLMLLLRFYTAVVCFSLFTEGCGYMCVKKMRERERERERKYYHYTNLTFVHL